MKDTRRTNKVAPDPETTISQEASNLGLDADTLDFIRLYRDLPPEGKAQVRMALLCAGATERTESDSPVFAASRIVDFFPPIFGEEEKEAIRSRIAMGSALSPVLHVATIANTPQATAFHIAGTSVFALMVRPGREQEDAAALAAEIERTGGEPMRLLAADGTASFDLRIRGWEDGPVFHMVAVIGEVDEE